MAPNRAAPGVKCDGDEGTIEEGGVEGTVKDRRRPADTISAMPEARKRDLSQGWGKK